MFKLQIKDDVDLKELKKYGFERNEYEEYSIYYFTIEENDDMDCCILVNDTDNNDRALRFMYANDCDFKEGEEAYVNYDCLIPEVIYDLIKAGIVVKVGE